MTTGANNERKRTYPLEILQHCILGLMALMSCARVSLDASGDVPAGPLRTAILSAVSFVFPGIFTRLDAQRSITVNENEMDGTNTR